MLKNERIMKRIIILFALLLGSAVGYAQSGGEVLAKVSERLSEMGSYRIDFEVEMASATATSKGYCLVDEALYLIAIDGMEQGFDGQKMWMVDGISKEVVYDNHKPQSHNLFENPTKAFDFSEELFTVVSLKEEKRGVWSITLAPKVGVLEGVEYVVLYVDQKGQLPVRLGYDMAGAGISINILSIKPQRFSPEEFSVEVPDGYEVIDFR